MSYEYYHYSPSLVAAIIFAVLFSITTLTHIFQALRKKALYFIPFIIGGLFECVGYVARAISAKQAPNETLGPYIIQSLLLLLGPTLYAASMYMVLKRLILVTGGEGRTTISPRWVTKIFILGDVISFLAQSGGGGMLAKAETEDERKRGQHMIIFGLIVQIIFFALFAHTTAMLHYFLTKLPTARSQNPHLKWRKLHYVLYGTSSFVMVRSVFRLIEYITGTEGPLMSTEAYIYVFDAALMFMTSISFNIWHPATIMLFTEPGSGEDAGEGRGEYTEIGFVRENPK